MDMISAKQAAVKARDYLVDMSGIKPESVSIEEVELLESEGCWQITLAYYSTSALPKDVFQLTTSYEKYYKVFLVHASSGEVISMKIRAAN